MIQKKIIWILSVCILIVLTIATAIVSISYGEIKIPISKILYFLKTPDSIEYSVLTLIRIPRTILAFSIGGALSISGAILQAIYRNPLVEPYTLGISGGASLGITIVIVFGIKSILILPISGFLGALATIFIVYILSIKKGAININKMLLSGIMISFIASSAVMFLMSTTSSENIYNIVFWTMGSLSQPNTQLIKITLIISILGLALANVFANPLNALRLSAEKAKHLGINTDIIIKILFLATSILTGVSIAVAGIIGFVGLIIPHFVRLIFGNDYRILITASFLSGSIFLIICDSIARTIVLPNELPVGVITGIIGGTVFILLLTHSKINN